MLISPYCNIEPYIPLHVHWQGIVLFKQQNVQESLVGQTFCLRVMFTGFMIDASNLFKFERKQDGLKYSYSVGRQVYYYVLNTPNASKVVIKYQKAFQNL